MTKINLTNVYISAMEKHKITHFREETGEDIEECVKTAMRDCSKITLERVLKNLSTGVKYEKTDVEKVIKLTLKELE